MHFLCWKEQKKSTKLLKIAPSPPPPKKKDMCKCECPEMLGVFFGGYGILHRRYFSRFVRQKVFVFF